VRVKVRRAAVASMFQPSGTIGRKTQRAAGRIRDRGKENSTVFSGLMRNSIVSELAEQGRTSITWRIGSNVEHTLYQELGTGPIFPRRAPLLVFKIGNRWISTYSTRGVPAVRMLTRAVEATSIEDFR
jgi:hypothetical protein